MTNPIPLFWRLEMKTVLQTLCALLLLVAPAFAQQIGQVQFNDGPITIGEGSLMTRGEPLKEQATLTNLTTGDVIDTVLPSELRTQLTAYNPVTGRWDKPIDAWVYIVKHAPPVNAGDLILVTVDGTPTRLMKVRKYTVQIFFVGSVTVWDLIFEKSL